MAVWFCLIIGVVVGMFRGGWKSIEQARRREYGKAERSLRIAALVAAGCGGLATTLTLGWPFKSVSVSVPAEVAHTVVEAVTVPKWIFWSTTEYRTREVTETIFRNTSSQEFSPALVLPMLVVGWICYQIERRLVHLAWRKLG